MAGIEKLTEFREYTIIKQLRVAAGQSDVYAVRKTEGGDDRPYLLKIYGHGAKAPEHILNQIMALGGDHSENLIRMYDCGFDEDAGRYFEIQEYIRYGSLNRVMDAMNEGNRDFVMSSVVEQTLNGLKILHDNKILHLDLKPSNILIKSDKPFKIVLTDFGLSSVLDRETSWVQSQVKGTNYYQAPEVYLGSYHKKTDYWAFGIIIYELLLGENPFKGKMPPEVMNIVTNQKIEISDEIEKKYFSLLKGLLTKDVTSRWGFEEVSKWLAGETVEYQNEKVYKNPYPFGKIDYYTLKDIFKAFGSSEKNIQLAKIHISKRYLITWLEKAEDFDTAAEVEAIIQSHENDAHGALLELIQMYGAENAAVREAPSVQITPAVENKLEKLVIDGGNELTIDTLAEFDLKNIALHAVYSDGSRKNISGQAKWRVRSGGGKIDDRAFYIAPAAAEKVLLEAVYSETGVDSAKELKIEVKQVLSYIKITEYSPSVFCGDKYDLRNIKTFAVYTDKSEEEIKHPAWTIKSGNGYVSEKHIFVAPEKPCQTTLQMTHSKDGVTKAVDIKIDISNHKLISISLDKREDSLFIGESYDLSKVMITARYSDGFYEKARDVEWQKEHGCGKIENTKYVSGNKTENAVLTASFTAAGVTHSAKFRIDVFDKLKGISLSKNSETLTEGNKFQLDQIVVAATYEKKANKIIEKPIWSVKSGSGRIDGAVYEAPEDWSGVAELLVTYSENGFSASEILKLTVEKKAEVKKESTVTKSGELTTFRQYSIIKQLRISAGQSDMYVVKKSKGGDSQHYLLKLYRYGSTMNEEIFGRILKLSEKHPLNLIRIYEYGFDDDLERYYEIQEFIKYGSLHRLASILNDSNRESVVKSAVKQIIGGLKIIHENNILHLDLKPSNILIRSNTPFNLVLTDFGLSSMLDINASKAISAVNKGTIDYMAPEAYKGEYHKKTDYWSFGIIIYELLIGASPFAGKTPAEVMGTVLFKNIEISDKIDKNYIPLLKGLLNRSLRNQAA